MKENDLTSENIEKGFSSLMKIHKRAPEVIRKLNGEKDYLEIAKEIELNKTIVSSIQKEAYKLRFVIKKGRFYKKKPGILKYAPKIRRVRGNFKKRQTALEKLSRKKFREKNFAKRSSFLVLHSSSAQKMAEAYQWLYVTENAIRDLIRHAYGDLKNWWKIRVPQKIQEDVRRSMGNEKYDSAKRKDELEYTHLDQLKQIIIEKKNWKDFIPFLEISEKNAFIVKFEAALPSRNCISHSIPLNKEDLKIVDVRFSDIIKMIK